jgi:small-conductance mechanosensitive channel
MPVWAQANSTAAITVDGRVLFRVSRLEGFDAQPRADYANEILNRAVQSGEPVTVRVVQINDLPVIQVNGVNLLTVTRKDAPEGITREEQAQQWISRIEFAIKLAQEQRRPEYIRKAILLSAFCVVGAIALSFALGWIWRNWLPRLIQLRQRNAPQLIESFLPLSLAVVRVCLWLITVIYISNQFAQTRIWSRRIIDVLFFSFVEPIIPLGDKSYSVIQLLILLGLFAGLLIVSRSATKLLRSRILLFTGISRGAQETIALIACYTLIFIGTLVLLQLWGLDLSSLNIFAGVLGVGIGLGLQGIAKEFVSGLAIIFERHIEVGDFINVGEYMGTVERIGLRSTQIRTLDEVAMIVANSRFLEKEFVNWNHGNYVSRIRLPVPVAFGEDLSQVREALIDAAKDYPHVVSQPAPRVFFIGYGESSLEFELLVWIADPRRHPQIKSDLYFRIDNSLRDRNIQIPFPQRDLHFRGSLPVELSPQTEADLNNRLNNGKGEESKTE